MTSQIEINRLKEALEVLSGRRGDPLKRAVLLGELEALRTQANTVAATVAEIVDEGVPVAPDVQALIDEALAEAEAAGEKADQVILDLEAEGIALRAEADALRDLLRAEFAAADVVVSQQVIDLGVSLTSGYTAAIASEASIRTTQDGILAGLITTLETEVDGVTSSLSTEYYTLAQTDLAISNATTSLQSTLEGPSGSIGTLDARLTNDYLTSASTTTAIAAAKTEMVATLSGASAVLRDPLLAEVSSAYWSRTLSGGAYSLILGDPYPGGKTWQFVVTSSQNDGMTTDSDDTNWAGLKDADAYVLEVEFTVTSGSLNGASFGLTWINTGGTSYGLPDLLASNLTSPFALNARMIARKVFARPSAFSGTFARNVLTVLANDPLYVRATKTIRFHRIHLRPATDEETGGGLVGNTITAAVSSEAVARINGDAAAATSISTLTSTVNGVSATVTAQANTIADINGYLAASYTLRVKAGTAGAQLELVAADDPIEGATSVARVSAENIILAGSVSATQLAANSVTATQIAANAVTASAINVASLDAISANLGTITVGTANIANLSVNGAKITGLAISTDKIAGNAVTLPYSAFSASLSVDMMNVSMTRAGEVLACVNRRVQLTSSGANKSITLTLRIDGVISDTTTITARNYSVGDQDFDSTVDVYVSLSARRAVSAGTRTVRMEITGDTGFATIGNLRAWALGIFA